MLCKKIPLPRTGSAVCLWLMLLSMQAQAQTQVVTTYVTRVQEERQSTRFTLTEWLRIKERMRMMDLWLAMFSNPTSKENFRPELSLFYGVSSGGVKSAGSGIHLHEGNTTENKLGRAQLWLTNILSGTVGIRMLNIDLGAEAHGYEGKSRLPLTLTGGDAHNVSLLRAYSGNLRIFGKHVQDSSLVLKYGQYLLDQPSWATGTMIRYQNPTYGAELQLYLFKWLGLEGNFMKYETAGSGDDRIGGQYIDYGAYLEISLLRFQGGAYQRSWEGENTQGNFSQKENGLFYGLKLHF